MCIYIDMIYLGNVTHKFLNICTTVMTLDLPEISFPLDILRTTRHIFTKIYICIHIDRILLWIVSRHFSHICTRVMALDLRQNCVSAQYLGNKLDRFSPNFIYAFILTGSSLEFMHVIFRIFVPEL